MTNRLMYISVAIILFFSITSCKKDANQDEIDHGKIEEYIVTQQLDGQFSSSGLYYVIEEEGSAEHPNLYSTVTFTYMGYYLNGDEFDSGEYFTSSLSSLIIGWQEGLQYIGEGGKITMVIPSGLAYGSSGSGPIGPNEVIAFDVTLHYFTN
ncbi:MAG: peptidylprolyl isomerase [Bacteroidetes bacterium]|nr:peptidylprolyl isomerase [Bacteroidota bacterium]